MKKSKFNPSLLKEELKRFNTLKEYDFYSPNLNDDRELLYGTTDIKAEQDEAGGEEAGVDPAAADAVAGELGDEFGVDPNAPETPEGDMAAPPADPAAPPADPAAPPADAAAPPVEPAPAEPAPVEPEAPAEDEVEVDVTALVKSSEESAQAAKKASLHSAMLMNKLSDLEARIAKMDSISHKIENLEKEIVKRNPTPVEKLEMRSLDSYPYSQKLSDYWASKEGPYDVMNNKPKEYILTKDDVNSSFSDASVQKSFNVKPDDYEEEDVY
jgi:pyruvate/2-oxoglutarate dehydrogenase complex dihydrolipoamide acyltransferase (E2) component